MAARRSSKRSGTRAARKAAGRKASAPRQNAGQLATAAPAATVDTPASLDGSQSRSELVRPTGLVGKTEPRLWTPPLRPLTRETTYGFEVIDFARNVIGQSLLPWQEWLVPHALERNPDGSLRFRVILVLVARQSGKTFVLKVVSLWRLFVHMSKLVLGVAQDLGIARESWQGSIDTIRSTPDLASELELVRNTNGDEYFRLASGGRYRIGAATRSAGRGLSVDQLNLDELREQRTWAAWSALSKTTMAREDGQIWAFSNAGDDESVVLNHLREAALSGRDPSIFLAEWSAPDGCDLDDMDAIAQANPGLGYTVSEQAIMSALATDPPNVFRTEVLCQRVDSLDSAVDLGAWKACHDPAGSLDGVRDRVAVCLDVAPDGEHVTLAAAAELDDGRVRVEVVNAWLSTDAGRAELEGWLDRIKPAETAWFPSGPAAALAPIMRKLGAREIKGADVAAACMGLADLVRTRRIVQPGDPLLDAHLASASKLNQGDGWRFARRGQGHVDAAYAVAGAVQTALTLPAEKPAPWFGVV